MQETEKYKLKKPDADDFFNIEDFNENADKVEQALKENAEGMQELKAPSFDDSGTAEGINSFTDFMAKVKSKMNIFEFFRNFKAGLKFILHTGMIVDNYATKEKGFLPDATLVTSLKEQLDEQNKNINGNTWLLYGGIGIFQKTDLNTLTSFGNYSCTSNVTASTLINCPTNLAFVMKVYSGTGQNIEYIIQEITTHNEAITYKRCYNANAKTWTTWKKVITNSDLKRHHYNYENTGKDKEYAIQDVFYKLPADSDIHFVTVSCGNLFSLIVHKYIDHSYGSILRFGYGDRLTQYRIGADKWYKADLNHTESQIEKLV